jgi:E3 ubiquitin-protein ligase RNF115/126
MNNFNANFRSNSAFEDFVNRTMQMQEPASKPAAKEAVGKLPIITVEEKHCKKDEEKDILEPPSCPVCIDEISIGNEAMFMPCGHIFHPNCLKPWLKDNNTCPICRKELPVEN